MNDRRTSPPDVIVVGGGITGLAAAYELHVRGAAFVLVEASDRLGGLIRTERDRGYTIDSGAESLLVQKPAGVRLCEELGLGSRLMSSIPPRTAFVHARGGLHPLPSRGIFGIPNTWSGIAAYDLLPWSARAVMLQKAASQVAAPSDTRDESVGAFFRREFGPDTVALIAEPLLGGIHAGDVERLSMTAVAPRLAAMGDRGRVLHSLLHTVRPPATDGGLFRTLRGGMGEMVEAIERRLPAGSMHRNQEAQSLSRSGATWTLTCTNGTYSAPAVIICAPAYAAARLLAAVDADAARACANVAYVSTVSVAFAWPRRAIAHALDGSGFVVARRHSDLRITACTWVSSKWEERAPEGMVLLRAFLGSATDRQAASLADDRILTIARRDLSRVLGITGEPALTRVHRWTRAGAQHTVDHLPRMTRLHRRLAKVPGVFAAGSGFHSVGIPDCVEDGRSAARAAADYAKITE
jgi:oxygen-dependent protoporphyrinogen oxidase